MRLLRQASFLLAAVLACAQGSGEEASDMGYRGPSRNGIFPDSNLRRDWKTPPPLLWSYDKLGFGWGSPCVSRDTVSMVGALTAAKNKKPGDPVNSGRLLAFTLDGKLKWEKPYGPDVGGRWPGPRATPTYTDGLVIVSSSEDEVTSAFDAAKGELVWKVEPWKQFGSVKQGYHGYTATPLVAGDRVILSLCSRKDDVPSFVALDKRTGKKVWECKLPPCTTGQGWSRGDTSAVLVDCGERRMVVDHLWRCIAAVDVQDGRFLWKRDVSAGASSTPMCNQGFLLLETYAGKSARGVAMGKVAADGGFTELWTRAGLLPSFPHGVVLDGKVFLFAAKKTMHCLDAETGKDLMSVPAEGEAGSVIASDGLVFWQTGVGGKGNKKTRITVTKPTEKGFEVLGGFETSVRCESDPPWIHPAIAAGRLYVRFHQQMAVYDIRQP